MPVTDLQGSSVPFASLGRSILSLRRDQLHSIDAPHDVSSASSAHGLEIEVFQKRVADLLLDLSAAPSDDLLSLGWVRRLLDTFLICQEEFRAILFNSGKSQTLSKPPLDRIISEFFDRSVKALDVLNAIRDGIDQLRHWRQQLEIVVSSHSGKTLSEGQVRRTRRALTDLTLLMLDEKEAGGSLFFTHRNRSFGRGPQHRRMGSGGCSASGSAAAAHFRSLSWSVSRSWSAARQLQAIGNNLAAPRANEVTATNGLAVPVFTMNSMMLFVMWALVAAIPCQDRGLQIHFSVPRVFPWAAPLMSLHERILEESKRKERKNTSGLLREIMQIEKCSRQLSELLDQVEFPVTEEKESEARSVVEELVEVCGALKEELDPLERQVREVFRRIVRSRSEGIESLCKSD